MTKRQYTFWFTFVSSIANIIISGLIMAALILLSTLLMNKVFHIQNGSAYMAVWMVCFIAGIILGMLIFSKLCALVIDRWFFDKLDDSILGKYLPSHRKDRGERQAEKTKTNMPSSVLPPEDTFGE